MFSVTCQLKLCKEILKKSWFIGIQTHDLHSSSTTALLLHPMYEAIELKLVTLFLISHWVQYLQVGFDVPVQHFPSKQFCKQTSPPPHLLHQLELWQARCVILPLLFVSLVLQVLKNPASQKWVMISPWHYVFKAVCYAVFFPKIIIYILFAGQEVRIGKNCSWGLEYDGLRPYSRLRVHFPNTDWLRPVNNMFIFSLRYCFESNFCVKF